MKLNERIMEAQAIGRATSLLEQMNTRISVAGKGWRDKQRGDWETLRQIANQQVARVELLDKPEPVNETPELPKAI
jgi:hypothetical protein